MSHISKIELQVNDLGTLRRACSRLGLELIKGQKTFKWFAQDGKCDHAIKIPGANYEIGVLKAGNAFELNCDYYDPIIGKAIGTNGGLLKQAYAVERTKSEARRKGYTVIERTTESGVRLQVRMG
ncbi:MAG: hypothetical protein ABSF48_20650 [Thermodesulfobacteriota bacterium]|jgi:hypothetical protein